MSRYKWRDNLTLKERFKSTNTDYTCTHDDTPRKVPCQEPSHYSTVTLTFTRSEIEILNGLVELADYLYKVDVLTLKPKIQRGLNLSEYPYKEGY